MIMSRSHAVQPFSWAGLALRRAILLASASNVQPHHFMPDVSQQATCTSMAVACDDNVYVYTMRRLWARCARPVGEQHPLDVSDGASVNHQVNTARDD